MSVTTAGARGGGVMGLLRLTFTTPAQQSIPARCLFLIPVVLAVLKRMKKKKKKKKPVAGDEKKHEGPDPIGVIWKALWPKWFKKGPAGLGSGEMVLIMAGNIARVYVSHLIANNVRVGDGLLYLRDAASYRKFVFYSIRLSLTNNLLNNMVNFVRDSLARKWRIKLTGTLHSEYFSGSNFYHAEQHMKDSDVRCTEDVKALAEGFTEFFTAGAYTACTGVFYSLKVFWEFGAFYMAAPFMYFLLSSKVQPMVGKMDWSLYVKLAGVKAKFRTAQTRLLQHSEAIAALQV